MRLNYAAVEGFHYLAEDLESGLGIHDGNDGTAGGFAQDFTYVSHKPQQKRDLIFDADSPVDILDVSLDGPLPYAKSLCYLLIAQTLANKLGVYYKYHNKNNVQYRRPNRPGRRGQFIQYGVCPLDGRQEFIE